jgi:hypothetical protein
MKEETKDISSVTLAEKTSRGECLVAAIRARIDPLGGVVLGELERELTRNPPGFDRLRL